MGIGKLGFKVPGVPGIQQKPCHSCEGKKKMIDKTRACQKCKAKGKLLAVITEPWTSVPGIWMPTMRVLQGKLLPPQLPTDTIERDHPCPHGVKKGSKEYRAWKQSVTARKRAIVTLNKAELEMQSRMDAQSNVFFNQVSVVVTCKVQPHSLFTWSQNTADLRWQQPIHVSLCELLYGFRRTITSIDGMPLTFESPIGFKPHENMMLRIPQKGMRMYGSNTTRGDLIVTIQMKWPIPRLLRLHRTFDPNSIRGTPLLGEREHENTQQDLETQQDIILSLPASKDDEEPTEDEENDEEQKDEKVNISDFDSYFRSLLCKPKPIKS